MINYVASWFSALCSSGLHLHYCCNILHSFDTNLYFAIGMGMKYYDEYFCLSIHSHNSKTTWPICPKFFVHVACIAIRYVLQFCG